MATHAERNRTTMAVREILFADRSPARDGLGFEGFLLQQRYDKSKRRENGKVPAHRRNQSYGIPQRSIAPSSLPKQELSDASVGAVASFA
ncbi:MAG: hypothetical protein GXX91_08075 [Verrucomicrobiaceae bacterium]|nr:hypothetical protein [Verrucomicrobiaceae bacterium]